MQPQQDINKKPITSVARIQKVKEENRQSYYIPIISQSMDEDNPYRLSGMRNNDTPNHQQQINP